MMNEKKMLDNELDNVAGGAANGSLIYQIAHGDTLSGIAARFGTTVDRLLALNPHIKNPDKIYAGDKIRIC